MNVFSALVDELKGVLGKGYLLAGVIPAAVFMMAFRWYVRRDSSLAEVFTSLSPLLVKDSSDGLAALVAFASTTLFLAVVLFAARSALLDFVQRLPGRVMRWPRELLQRRQAIKLQRALHNGEQHLHGLTVLKWALDGAFEQPDYLPPHREPLDWAEMIERSAVGREAFEACLPKTGAVPKPPPPRQAKRIIEGLSVLYDRAVGDLDDENLQDELSLWKIALAQPPEGADPPDRPKTGRRLRAELLLQLLKGHLRRQWALPRQRLEGFPRDEHILPTTLGTRAAALDGYTLDRYGIDASTLLVRLWAVLDEAEQKSLANIRLSLEFFLNLGAALLLLVPAALARNLYDAWPLSLPTDRSLQGLAAAVDLRTVFFVAIPFLLAALLYRAAVFTYGALAEKVLRNVDLKRLDLIAKLGYERPKTVGEEQELWRELSGFFVDGYDRDPQRPLGGQT